MTMLASHERFFVASGPDLPANPVFAWDDLPAARRDRDFCNRELGGGKRIYRVKIEVVEEVEDAGDP